MNDFRYIGRYVSLPPDLDEKLRVLAFRQEKTKSAIMVEALALYFEQLKVKNATNTGN